MYQSITHAEENAGGTKARATVCEAESRAPVVWGSETSHVN